MSNCLERGDTHEATCTPEEAIRRLNEDGITCEQHDALRKCVKCGLNAW